MSLVKTINYFKNLEDEKIVIFISTSNQFK
jgi:hypothetical protein